MNFAVKKDGSAWRAVNGVGDVGSDENYSETQPEIVIQQPVQKVVTMRQARLALLQGGYLTTINAAIAAMPGAAGDAARIEWEFSSTVERNRPLVAAMASALSLTSAQIDDLFKLAATL